MSATAGFTVQNKKSQIVLNTSINSSSYVQALNEYGEEIIVDGEDEMAKCFCHELEHLDGMIFLDKAIEELSVV